MVTKNKPSSHSQRNNSLKTGLTEVCLCSPEQLTVGSTKRTSKKWDQEFDALVLPLLEDDVPCYILYRLDSSNNQGHEWVFLAYTPDKSTVRSRASTWFPLMTRWGCSQ